MAGPSGTLLVRIYRVRPLRPVRTLPAGSGSPDVGADTPAIFVPRVGTLTAGTAPAFGWPLALRYGSDLLTLRLLSLLQRGDSAFSRDYMLSLGRVVGSWIAPKHETNRVVSMEIFAGNARCPRAPTNLLQRSSPEQVCGETWTRR
jgi:hypothetical protein